MDERDRLFFEHDLATPLTNLQGAGFLLQKYLSDPEPRLAEALDILSSSTTSLEKMLYWYWRTRELPGTLEPSAPWPAADLPRILSRRAQEWSSPLPAPEAESALVGRLLIPQEPLATGLVGAGVTLGAAAKAPVRWLLTASEGVVHSRFEAPGDREDIDPPRLFRKFYWPGHLSRRGTIDPGLPYLEAVLAPFGGVLELIWRRGSWILEASLPHC